MINPQITEIRWGKSNEPGATDGEKFPDQEDDAKAPPSLAEGEDYYLEGSMMVFTERFLLRRGFCCESGCRHCPYGFSKDKHDS